MLESVGILLPAVSAVGPPAAEARAGVFQSSALLVGGPPVQVAAVQAQEDKALEQDRIAKSVPIVAVAA